MEQQHSYCSWIVPPVFHNNSFLVHWLEPSTKHQCLLHRPYYSIWWHHPVQTLLYGLQAKLKSGISDRVVPPNTNMVCGADKSTIPRIYIFQYKSVCWSKWRFDRNTLFLLQQDWVAFMSQPYWIEVKVEVEFRLILRLRLIWGWGWSEVKMRLSRSLVEIELKLRLS